MRSALINVYNQLPQETGGLAEGPVEPFHDLVDAAFR